MLSSPSKVICWCHWQAESAELPLLTKQSCQFPGVKWRVSVGLGILADASACRQSSWQDYTSFFTLKLINLCGCCVCDLVLRGPKSS